MDAELSNLLAHADWLRRLATHLVGGQEAGDLVQQTWLAALRSPPDPARPARPWLAQVLRNFAARQRRESHSRRAREGAQAALEEAAVPSPEGLLEAAQIQRLLAELVIGLDEPFRSTTLARYYQGLQPTQIARELGIPAGTVRWRLSEAMRRLRGELDRRQGVDRSWRAALLPFVVVRKKGGVLAMSMTTKVALVGGVVTAALIGGGVVSARRGRGGGGVGQTGSPETMVARPEPGRKTALGPPSFTPAPLPSRGREAVPASFKEELQAAIRAVSPALKDCYRRTLDGGEGATWSEVKVRLKLGPGGLDEAGIVPRSDDGGIPELVSPLAEQCLLAAIATANFPRPERGSITTFFRVVLSSGPDAGAP